MAKLPETKEELSEIKEMNVDDIDGNEAETGSEGVEGARIRPDDGDGGSGGSHQPYHETAADAVDRAAERVAETTTSIRASSTLSEKGKLPEDGGVWVNAD